MKTLKFQKYRYFITENYTLLNQHQSKAEFLSKIFKNTYRFDYYGKGYEYKFRHYDCVQNIVLGTIGRYSNHPFYDEDLNVNTNEEYEFSFIIINLNSDIDQDANAQSIYLHINKKLSANVYNLLKSLTAEINNKEDHKIFTNPENLANEHFWDAVNGNVITKLVITYAPKNLFNHKPLTDLAKEVAEKMNAQETKVVIENSLTNSTGLNFNNQDSKSFMNEVLDDTSKGAATLRAYSKRNTCYNSESKEEVVEKEIIIQAENLNNKATILEIVKELFKD